MDWIALSVLLSGEQEKSGYRYAEDNHQQCPLLNGIHIFIARRAYHAQQPHEDKARPIQFRQIYLEP